METTQLEKELNSLRYQAKASAQQEAFYQKSYVRAQRKAGGQPNMAQILLAHFYIIEEITIAYVNSKGGSSAIKNMTLTDSQMNQIVQFCQKANNTGKTVSYGASGAALGASLFGWLGLIGGAIVGAAAGSNSTKNDRAAFIALLNDTIDYYYNCLLVINQPLYLTGEPERIDNSDVPEIKTTTPTPEETKEGEDAEKQLNDLIGLASIKRQVLMMKASLKKQKFTNNKINLHMCFYGNPGTGKTEVARLIAKIFHKEGILPSSKFIETDRSGLVAEYVGQTAIKTHAVFKKAMGGVLFIDEAYSLAEGGGQDYGKEAVAALLKDMEDYRDKVCVILAGYKKPMEKMFDLNPGFKSRVNRYIDFPNYSREEIKEIVLFLSKKAKYTIIDDALEKIVDIVMSRASQPNFANAREARNVLDSIIDVQALRTESNVSDTTIILDDVLEYMNFNSVVL